VRQAVGQVSAALAALPGTARDIGSPLQPGHAGLISAGGRSALVTFQLPGNGSNEDQQVLPALRAVAAVAARHRGCAFRRPVTRAPTGPRTRSSAAISGRPR
jgi:putative drug exporter of the RND superfamily